MIKEFDTSYKQEIMDLIVGIQRDEFQIPITAECQPDLQDIPGYYQQGMGNFWIADIGGCVAGTIALIDIGNNQGVIRKMFVKNEFRGKEFGVSSALLVELLVWANGHHIKEIFLGTIDKFIGAHKFYEKNGFNLIQKNDLPTNFPMMEVDHRFYGISL